MLRPARLAISVLSVLESPEGPDGENGDVLAAFAALFRRAAQRVAADYLQLPRHPRAEDDSGVILLERVYCYELYHQLRRMLEAKRIGPIPGALARGWRLNAEVAKATSYLPFDWVPDFIWHLPGKPQNGHVIEVKRANETTSRIRADLPKLLAFRDHGHYERATLLVVGTHDGQPGHFDDLAQSAQRAGIELLFHQHAGVRPSASYAD